MRTSKLTWVLLGSDGVLLELLGSDRNYEDIKAHLGFTRIGSNLGFATVEFC